MSLHIKEVPSFQARFHMAEGIIMIEIGKEICQIVKASVSGRKFFHTRCIS